MHCPTCREENAPTTRFCTSCGAVLVEEAPGGGRRRVLRPWGLRRTAPPTVSPDLPESGATAGAQEDRRGRRTDLWLAGGVVAALVVGTMLYPTLRSEAGATTEAARDAAPRPAAVASSTVAGSDVVTMPAPAMVQETRLVAPPLVEPKPAPAPPPAPAARTVASNPVAAPTVPPPAPRLGGTRGLPAVAVAYPMPPRETVIRDGHSAEVVAQAPIAAAPAPVPKPVDRWQPLRDELAHCQPLGLFQRAMCEQGARLAHCDGFWGQASLCPAGRTEYGQ